MVYLWGRVGYLSRRQYLSVVEANALHQGGVGATILHISPANYFFCRAEIQKRNIHPPARPLLRSREHLPAQFLGTIDVVLRRRGKQQGVRLRAQRQTNGKIVGGASSSVGVLPKRRRVFKLLVAGPGFEPGTFGL
jgi:hypothetical protein